MNKTIIIIALLLAACAAEAQYVTIAISNSAPDSPRVTWSGALMRRSAYQFNLTFYEKAGTPLNLTNKTVTLNWKRSDALTDGPVNVVTGSVANATNGLGTVIVAKDQLKLAGDVQFTAVAQDTTNRAAFFWTTTIYEPADQAGD